MKASKGWMSYSSGDNSHLIPEVRAEVERRATRRHLERGPLRAVVEVRVYENDEEAQVSFPPDAFLGAETESTIISEVVARAREHLAQWR
jgi:hypothetical protein